MTTENDDAEIVDARDWYADDDIDEPDVACCPWCLKPIVERDDAGRTVPCCRAAAAAFEEG